MNNPFLLPDEEYTRNIDSISSYIEQQAFYISTLRDKPYEQVRTWLFDRMKDESTGLKDPMVNLLSRENSIDRFRTKRTLSSYIGSVAQLDYPMMPTFTVYQPRRVRESLYSSFIEDKKAGRKKHKKLMFKAIMEGNKEKAQQENNNQQSLKIKINALSGAALMAFSPNYTVTLHPTLTSVCRISTSYANANNEKFMGGNRQYLTEVITLDDINLLAMKADQELIEIAVAKYNIKYPTAEQALECIRYSSDLYWSRGRSVPRLVEYLNKLAPYQLANIVYSGDLYHLAALNPEVVIKFITDFTEVPRTPVDEPASYLDSVDGHTVAYVSLLCSDLLQGVQLHDVRNNNPELYKVVGGVCKGTIEMIGTYSDFIQAFLRPLLLTPDVFNIESIERKVVVTSDTDSTIFTTQHWTKLVTGSYNFNPTSYRVGYFMTLLSSQMTVHLLAMMSRNIGVELDSLHKISMKSEYYFPVYSLTGASKHYYAYISAREGNVYEELELEVKGVSLRTSNLPPSVMEPFNKQLHHVLSSVIKNNELTISDVLQSAYDTETKVRNSLETGSIEYLKSFQLKTPDSYKDGMDSANYKAHTLWQECFAFKYGDAPDLPYVACSVGTTLTNKSSLIEWLGSIEDKRVADRLAEWIAREDKRDLPTIRVPKILFDKQAIPKEIVDAIDVPKTLLNIMGPWYLYLESMGFFLRNDKNTRLITNEFKRVLVNGLGTT